MKKLFIISLVSFFSFPAIGDSWRCSKGIVSTGDTKGVIIAKCGDPLFTDLISYAKNRQGNENNFSQNETIIEELTYQENDSVLRILRFENGKLINIETRFNHNQEDTAF